MKTSEFLDLETFWKLIQIWRGSRPLGSGMCEDL